MRQTLIIESKTMAFRIVTASLVAGVCVFRLINSVIKLIGGPYQLITRALACVPLNAAWGLTMDPRLRLGVRLGYSLYSSPSDSEARQASSIVPSYHPRNISLNDMAKPPAGFF